MVVYISSRRFRSLQQQLVQSLLRHPSSSNLKAQSCLLLVPVPMHLFCLLETTSRMIPTPSIPSTGVFVWRPSAGTPLSGIILVVVYCDGHSTCALFYVCVCSSDFPCLHSPVNLQGHRVFPSGIGEYRDLHDIINPPCLCSSADDDATEPTESAIMEIQSGTLAGSWVACCANFKCGYWSKVLFTGLFESC